MNKYPVYYDGNKYCVDFNSYHVDVYLVERPKNILQTIKNVFANLSIEEWTLLELYYDEKVEGEPCFVGDGDGNWFYAPAKDDDYYINVCKKAVAMAAAHHKFKHSAEIAEKTRKEKLKNWDGHI